MKIAPSVLASDFSRLGEESAAMELAGADLLHLDVMDGHFVPNITFGPPVVERLRRWVSIPFDVHLMISEPHRYAGQFAKAGADIITFHVEADCDIGETIDLIKSHGAVPGLVVKPKTSIDSVFPYLERVGMVLVMTVEPGFGGQSFMSDMLPKVSELRSRIDALGLSVDIQVDGGISRETIALAAQAGANVFVVGSALFSQKDYAGAIAELRSAVDN